MERNAFLSKLRARLVAGAPANLPHPMPPYAVPELSYTADLSDPVNAFTKKATGALATVRRVEQPSELLSEVVHAHGVRRAVVSRDPEVEAIADTLRGLDVEVIGLADREAAARSDLGITGAAWGIAATGTVVADAARAGGRAASLLPPVHLAFVRAESILPSPGALFRRMTERFPDGPTSQFVLITGPSRSADIELTLTMGVHGPKQLYIGILG